MSKLDEDGELKECLTEFSKKQETRLANKEGDGWYGWDDDTLEDDFKLRAIKNIMQGHYVDAANLIMFLWSMSGRNSK